MKLKSIILAAGTAAALASCAQVSDVTEITGTVIPEGVDQVQVTVGEQIDTLVPVVDGKFTLTLPTDVCQLGTVAAGQYGLNFIPDGTPLNVVLDEESSITSKYPKISAQAKLNAYLDTEDAYVDEYRAKRAEIFQAQIQLPLLDILPQNFHSRVMIAPLVGISRLPHKGPGIFVDGQDLGKILQGSGAKTDHFSTSRMMPPPKTVSPS